MHIKKLKFGGMGRFHAEVELPIEQLNGAALVALVGVNGTGKTTSAEMLPGAIYRSTPSRGALARLANSKSSFVELVVETDDTYTCRVLIDGCLKSPKTEAYITDSAGAALNNGKTGTYDKEIARRFPSKDVLLASAFACQTGEGSFLELPVARRRELFVEMIGAGRLQALADSAAVRAKKGRDELLKLGFRLEAGKHLVDSVGRLTKAVEGAENQVAASKFELGALEQQAKDAACAIDAWQEYSRRIELDLAKAEVGRDRAIADRNAKTDASIKLADRRTEMRAKASGLKARLGQRDQLEAIIDVGDIDERIAELEQEIDTAHGAEAAYGLWSIDHARLTATSKAAKTEYEMCVSVATTECISAKEGLVMTTKAAESGHATKLAAADEAVRRAELDLEVAEKLAGRVGQVPCGGDGGYAGCLLIKDAMEAKSHLSTLVDAILISKEKADDLRESRAPDTAVTEAQERVGVAKKAWKAAESNTADIDAADEDLKHYPSAPVQSSNTRLVREVLAGVRKTKAAGDAAKLKLAVLDDVQRQRDDLYREVDKLVAEIDTAIQELDEAKALGELADKTIGNIRQSMDEHRSRKPPMIGEVEIKGARDRQTAAVAELATLAGKMEVAKEAVADAVELRKKIAAHTTDVDDWEHLQKAFGPRGIQALEIDCAGPEVSGLANELLHACYGNRFTVDLTTTALKSDGKGTKEIFDLRVIDIESGTDGSASMLSGGEKVLVGEALSLAIAIYNTRRSSIPMLDLFRDECSGALSAENAALYVAMLRRALELGGFKRCYFVAHQPSLWGMADARILFEDGGCRLVDEVVA